VVECGSPVGPKSQLVKHRRGGLERAQSHRVCSSSGHHQICFGVRVLQIDKDASFFEKTYIPKDVPQIPGVCFARQHYK
jgi:hypothetical protein